MFSRTRGELVFSIRGEISSASILGKYKNLALKPERLEIIVFTGPGNFQMRKRGPCGRPVEPTLMPQSFSSWPPTVHGILFDIQAKNYNLVLYSRLRRLSLLQSMLFAARICVSTLAKTLILIWVPGQPLIPSLGMKIIIFSTLCRALLFLKRGELLYFMRLSYVRLISNFCFYLHRTYSMSDVDWPNLIKSYRGGQSTTIDSTTVFMNGQGT